MAVQISEGRRRPLSRWKRAFLSSQMMLKRQFFGNH